MGISTGLLRFCSFEVDLEVRELRRNGRRVKLQDKPLQILIALLERPGRLVSREELHRRLWSEDTFVDFDHNLNNAVEKLRRALSDSAEQPKFIETLPKRGYRFIADVELCTTHDAPHVTEVAPQQKAVIGASTSPTPLPLSRPDQIDPPVLVTPGKSLKRRLGIRLAVVTSFLLALLFIATRFFGSPHIPVSSANSGDPEIKALVIGKNGALDPTAEGFKLHLNGQYETEAMRNPTKPGWDRLKIISNDGAYYYRALSAAEKQFALDHDWTMMCVCALEKGSLSTNIDFGPGLRRFDIELLREGDNYYVALTRAISPELVWEQKVEFAGVGDIDHPHTYELRYDHAAQTATLLIDGRQMASGYRGHTQFLEDRGLIFGSYNYANSNGVGVFRTVGFEAR